MNKFTKKCAFKAYSTQALIATIHSSFNVRAKYTNRLIPALVALGLKQKEILDEIYLDELWAYRYAAAPMKLKTKKAAAKRFSFTATGKVKFKRTNKRHNLGNKSSARKLKLRSGGYVFEGDIKHVEKCMPYGS